MLSAWRRCLEGLFDTYGAFGRGFTDDLERGGPKPYGARKANLSTDALPYAQEIALQEQVCLGSQHTRHLKKTLIAADMVFWAHANTQVVVTTSACAAVYERQVAKCLGGTWRQALDGLEAGTSGECLNVCQGLA